MGFSLRKSFKVGKNSKVNLSTGGVWDLVQVKKEREFL